MISSFLGLVENPNLIQTVGTLVRASASAVQANDYQCVVENPNLIQPVGTLVRVSASVVQANDYQLVMSING